MTQRANGGLPPMLRATNQYCDSLAICGWRVPSSQSPRSLTAGGAWYIGGALFRSLPSRTRVGLPPLRSGRGDSIRPSECSSVVCWRI